MSIMMRISILVAVSLLALVVEPVAAIPPVKVVAPDAECVAANWGALLVKTWYTEGDAEYWMSDNRLSQPNAHAACLAMGSELVSIHSSTENLLVRCMGSGNCYKDGFQKRKWTGGLLNWTLTGSLVTPAWTDGTQFDFGTDAASTPWVSSAQENYCLTYDGKSGGWRDDLCNRMRFFVCERHLGTTTTTITPTPTSAEVDRCASSPCLNGGTCYFDPSSPDYYYCQCPTIAFYGNNYASYTGDNCENDVDECTDYITNPFVNSPAQYTPAAPCFFGTCVNDPGSFHCECDTTNVAMGSWSGAYCDQCVPPPLDFTGFVSPMVGPAQGYTCLSNFYGGSWLLVRHLGNADNAFPNLDQMNGTETGPWGDYQDTASWTHEWASPEFAPFNTNPDRKYLFASTNLKYWGVITQTNLFHDSLTGSVSTTMTDSWLHCHYANTPGSTLKYQAPLDYETEEYFHGKQNVDLQDPILQSAGNAFGDDAVITCPGSVYCGDGVSLSTSQLDPQRTVLYAEDGVCDFSPVFCTLFKAKADTGYGFNVFIESPEKCNAGVYATSTPLVVL